MSRAFPYRCVHIAHDIDLLTLQSLDKERYPHLLCSASQGGKNNRYDVLMAFPEETLCLTEQGLKSDLPKLEASLYEKEGEPFVQRSFLNTLDAWFFREQRLVQQFSDSQKPVEFVGFDEASQPLPDLPFTGGWFLYLSYELASEIEPSLNLPLPTDEPIAFATRFSNAIIRDKSNGHVYCVQETHNAKEQFVQREHLLEIVKEDIQRCLACSLSTHPVGVTALTETPDTPYLEQVARIKEYIKEGDVFQVNLSRLWRTQLANEQTSSVELFSSLRAHNPSPFAALTHFPGLDVISSSPERLVSVRNGLAETRPIAGTRPRVDKNKDEQVKSELVNHPKERSEHIMLIDLERNDLGRVCQPGTVEVNELMVTEQYEHVHHIVSNVRGQLREDVLPAQVIAAVFPGGTITGCPKVRCMEILTDLEQQARGAYTGSLGYLNLNGDMDLNILIRTISRKGNALMFRAGGGIVHDSIPDKELQETRAKAKGMVKALNPNSQNHQNSEPKHG